MQQRKRSAGDHNSQQEDSEALELVPDGVLPSPDAEGEPPVGGGVADCCDRQRQKVGQLRARHAAQQDK